MLATDVILVSNPADAYEQRRQEALASIARLKTAGDIPATSKPFDWLGLITGVAGAAQTGTQAYFSAQQQASAAAQAEQLKAIQARAAAMQQLTPKPVDYTWLWIILGIGGLGAIALIASRKGK